MNDIFKKVDELYSLIKKREFDVETLFKSADKVSNLTVFNIGGNKARLIAAIHYNTQKIYIRHVLTHKEYDQGSWRK